MRILQKHNNWIKTKVETGLVIQYIIVNKDNNEEVGSVYLRNIDRINESAEYGFFIGEDRARGKGIGTETARLFTDFALKNWGLHRIYLRVLANNVQAYKSYKKAGFIEEGRHRDMVKLNGSFQDMIFMSIICNDSGSGERK
ncbi:MAG TPA: GNAT family protein [Lachnospiraceae bacterium]|nr:GNAT family protein [Lachnospiraceae bacterium]